MNKYFVLLPLLLIMVGCGTQSQVVPNRILPVKQESKRVIVKEVKRKCDPIPEFRKDFTKPQYDEWVLTLLTAYKRCSK